MFSQDPGDQKNLLMAILLSVGVMLAWQFFYASPKIKEEQERRRIATEQQAKTSSTPGAPATAPVGGSAPTAPAGGTAPTAPTAGSAPVVSSLSRSAALARTQRVPIKTPAVTGSINCHQPHSLERLRL